MIFRGTFSKKMLPLNFHKIAKEIINVYVESDDTDSEKVFRFTKQDYYFLFQYHFLRKLGQ